MSLFENNREANLGSTVAMVEDVLVERGHLLDDCRRETTATSRAWAITQGSATVDITLVQEGDGARLRVCATIMTLDDRVPRTELFTRLLGLNASEVKDAAFALDGHHVLLVSERSTSELDRGEVIQLVASVCFFADRFDDELVTSFGGRRGRH